jgi:predicted kinase
LQASGKTTFYRQRLAATHAHVSKDHVYHRDRRQVALVAELLADGRSVAVDGTNPAPGDRAGLLGVAREYGAHTVAYWFPPDGNGSAAHKIVLRGPHPAERFDAVYVVRFDGTGGFSVE